MTTTAFNVARMLTKVAEPDDTRLFDQFTGELFSIDNINKDGGPNVDFENVDMVPYKRDEIGLDD